MDRFERLVDVLRSELKAGFGLLSEKIDQTNSRLDQTNSRLDQTNTRLTLFEVSMGAKLDGIGTYLRSINGSVQKHSNEIFDLKGRITKLEQTDIPPSSDQ